MSDRMSGKFQTFLSEITKSRHLLKIFLKTVIKQSIFTASRQFCGLIGSPSIFAGHVQILFLKTS
ncbi:MAG: hypothetical protein JHC31_00585, partial [Sulfurihydrogenibium sp.]|nr:hypothetical protein [Sulfurihydrogenibium sp.]